MKKELYENCCNEKDSKTENDCCTVKPEETLKDLCKDLFEKCCKDNKSCEDMLKHCSCG